MGQDWPQTAQRDGTFELGSQHITKWLHIHYNVVSEYTLLAMMTCELLYQVDASGYLSGVVKHTYAYAITNTTRKPEPACHKQAL